MIYESLKDKKRNVILDTDIGPDCDDVGALAVLLSYADELKLDILGICNCTSNVYGSATVDAVCKYCGYDNIKLGMYSKPGFFSDDGCCRYNKYIAERFCKDYVSGTLEILPHVSFYRSLLANSDDDSIVLITIGMFNTLSDLLESTPDKYSELDGIELVKRKVHCAISMAATLPSGREFNVVSDYVAAKNFFERFPKEIYISDAKLGISIITGYSDVTDERLNNSPIFESYRLYTEKNEHKNVNSSYDLTAVQFACEGEGRFYGLSERGRFEFYCENENFPEDATRFIPDPNGKVRYMIKNTSDEDIADELQRRMRSFDVK